MTNTPNRLNILKSGFEMPEHCGGDHWAILHGDSLQIVRQFEPHSFDAIITDPPYASGGANQNTKNRTTSEKYSSVRGDRALPDFDLQNLHGCLSAEQLLFYKAHGMESDDRYTVYEEDLYLLISGNCESSMPTNG